MGVEPPVGEDVALGCGDGGEDELEGDQAL